MQQPSTYLKPTSFPGLLPLPFSNGQGLGKEADLKLCRYLGLAIARGRCVSGHVSQRVRLGFVIENALTEKA